MVVAEVVVTECSAASDPARRWPSGIGLSYRSELSWLIHQRTRSGALHFCEVIAENIDPEHLPAPIARLLDNGVTVIPHGVSLSLGGAEPLCTRRLDHLARVAERLRSPFVSEHIAFVRAGGVEVGHLMPVARSDEMVGLIADNYARARTVLGLPLAVENVASLFEWPDDSLTEAQFLRAILDATGAPWLFDIANLYANAVNHHFDAFAALDRLPLDRIAYVHVAGGVSRDGLYHDTHAHAVPPACFSLLQELLRRTGKLPVLLERDRHFENRAALELELDTLLDVVANAPERRPPSPSVVPSGTHTASLGKLSLTSTTPVSLEPKSRVEPPSADAVGRIAKLQAQLARHIVELDAPAPWPNVDPFSFRASQRALADKHAAHA